MFEKHKNARHVNDDLHVRAISNPEEAAKIAALKLVMNTNLREKIHQIEVEHENRVEHWESIVHQKNIQRRVGKIINEHHNKSFALALVHHAILGRFLQ